MSNQSAVKRSLSVLWVSNYPSKGGHGSWGWANSELYSAISPLTSSIMDAAPLAAAADRLSCVVSRALFLVAGKRLMYEFSDRRLARFAESYRSVAHQKASDAALFYGTAPYLDIRTDRPSFCFTDSAYTTSVEWYQKERRFRKKEFERINRRESDWLHSLSGIFVSSEWARQDMIDRYGIEGRKIRCVKYGANLAGSVPPVNGVRDGRRILFIASDFMGKRGDVLIAAMDEAIQLLPEMRLTVVGGPIPDAYQRSYIDYAGWLDKTTEEGFSRFAELAGGSSLYVSCSLKDMTPGSIAEMFAFGVPCIAMGIAGVPEMVVEGESGWLLPADAGAEQIGRRIADAISDKDELARRGQRARKMYEEDWNWKSVARKIVSGMRESLTDE